jgi:hypothetical protein
VGDPASVRGANRMRDMLCGVSQILKLPTRASRYHSCLGEGRHGKHGMRDSGGAHVGNA